MANRFHKHFFVLVILSVSVAIGLGKIGNAASFDCNKAKTDVEKGICNDPELSKLDSEIAEIYQKFDKNSKYYREIVKAQREWITKDRYLHEMEFTIQRDFLKWNLLLTNCMEKKSWETTNLSNAQIFEKCFGFAASEILTEQCERSRYDSALCDRVVMKVYDFMEKALSKEVELQYHENYGPEVLSNFRKARQAWLNYREAYCRLGWSTYQGGSIAGGIYSSCIEGFSRDRIINDLLKDPWSLCGEDC